MALLNRLSKQEMALEERNRNKVRRKWVNGVRRISRHKHRDRNRLSVFFCVHIFISFVSGACIRICKTIRVYLAQKFRFESVRVELRKIACAHTHISTAKYVWLGRA